MGPGESRCYRLIELSQQKLAARAPDARHQAAGWPGESSRVDSSRVKWPPTHTLTLLARAAALCGGRKRARNIDTMLWPEIVAKCWENKHPDRRFEGGERDGASLY